MRLRNTSSSGDLCGSTRAVPPARVARVFGGMFAYDSTRKYDSMHKNYKYDTCRAPLFIATHAPYACGTRAHFACCATHAAGLRVLRPHAMLSRAAKPLHAHFNPPDARTMLCLLCGVRTTQGRRYSRWSRGARPLRVSIACIGGRVRLMMGLM